MPPPAPKKEPEKPKDSEKPREKDPAEEPSEQPNLTGGTPPGTPRIESPLPQGIVWSDDNFRLTTFHANIAPGPALLVFKQLQRLYIDNTIQPAGAFVLDFPIPENSVFAHHAKPTPKPPGTSISADLPGKPIGLIISYSAPGFPRPADPALTGLPRSVFPYHPVALAGGNSTVSGSHVGVNFIYTFPNTAFGTSRVIRVSFVYDGVVSTFWGRVGSLWIFFMLTGVSGLQEGVI
jgi:hypothetical protein